MKKKFKKFDFHVLNHVLFAIDGTEVYDSDLINKLSSTNIFQTFLF